MRALLWIADEQVYAIAIQQIVEVIPRVAPRTVGDKQAWLCGLINYRGSLVPLLDAGTLVGGPPCGQRMSNRILVVRMDETQTSGSIIALLVDRVIRVEDVEHCEVETHPGFALPGAEHLAAVVRTDAGLVQFVQPSKILTPEQHAVLFDRERTEAP